MFRKLRGHSPRGNSPQDKLLLACIRRMHLDTFWSRATTTVSANKDRDKQMLGFSKTLGLRGPFTHEGPFPSYSHCGYKVALIMLLHLTNKGRHANYLQFETIRKDVSTYENQRRASPQNTSTTTALVDDDGRYRRLVNDPCASMYFRRFLEGCSKRMGQDWRPNQALHLPFVLGITISV